MPSDVLNNLETIAKGVPEGTWQTPVETPEVPNTSGPTLHSRLAELEAFVDAYGPMIRELADVGDRAAQQGHSWTSILGAVGQQLLGIFLHRI